MSPPPLTRSMAAPCAAAPPASPLPAGLRPVARKRTLPVARATAVPASANLQAPSSSSAQPAADKEAILLQRFKAHQSAVTAALVTADTEHAKEFATASMDKSLALWTLPMEREEGQDAGAAVRQAVRMQPKVAPIFSLAAEVPSHGSTRRQVFCGNAAKSISTWELPAAEFENKVVLNGHTGWVRAVATDGRWLFSSGCNKIAQWDLSRSVPRKSNEVSLFTGDVQGLTTGNGHLFSCGADGSIRSWAIGRKGELTPSAARDKAHTGRVSAILCNSGFVYSVSYDGSIKMWDAANLELVQAVEAAHGGGKIHCAAIGPDRNLYTGGEDKLVRRWQLGSLSPAAASALYCHNYTVRSLAAGPLETIVSADSSGEVAVWKV